MYTIFGRRLFSLLPSSLFPAKSHTRFMETLLSRARHVLRLFRPGGVPYAYSEPRPPLFQTNSPWWAKYAYGLLACNIFMTGSAIDITWKHWSQAVKDESNEKDGLPSTEYYVLRPAWQRLGLCGVFFGGGVAAAAALFIGRIRFTRTFDVFPRIVDTTATGKRPTLTRPNQRQVFIQSVGHYRNRGLAFPLEKCLLERGRDDTEMLLLVEGERAHWYMDLSNALIDGEKASSVYKAREVVLKNWKGGLVSEALLANPHPAIDGRWKQGPLKST
ncbi:hypothetical protein K435DRAFT_23759 [Dendrothele bispora CBS 962.96]|uniref:Uncharacterized protein n=1 Tax=Dendrothele bispora (strain CBS 962.96) TaxID=1314807 RepID=A0A4S8MSQ4_DENBC|nr:hypothetical protein K435DRAFT_23759 [Dendrothele bispora CBS 962.96]